MSQVLRELSTRLGLVLVLGSVFGSVLGLVLALVLGLGLGSPRVPGSQGTALPGKCRLLLAGQGTCVR